MEVYYRELKKIRLLTAHQEHDLWVSYKEKNNPEARQELIRYYQPLVFKLVKQYCPDRDLMLDLIQEGNIGLIDAVDSFDHLREIKFSTFATYHIRGRIIDFLKKGINVEPFLAERSMMVTENKVEKNYLLEKVYKVMESLPLKEQKILKELYLGNKEPQLVATEMGISLSYLYRLQKKAVKRVRGKLARFIQQWKG
jgi:RNA polymerase sporulation-specific sigma factor